MIKMTEIVSVGAIGSSSGNYSKVAGLYLQINVFTFKMIIFQSHSNEEYLIMWELLNIADGREVASLQNE